MTQDASDTRHKLLDAAEDLFAERSFDAVSIRDIAADAEVNVAAVNYHFQSKENLYHEVFRRRLAAKKELYVTTIEAALRVHGRDVRELVRAFFRVHLTDTLKNRHGANFMRLLVRELHHGQVIQPERLREALESLWSFMGRKLVEVAPQLAEEQVTWVLGSLHGQLVHFTMRWYRFHTPFGPDKSSDPDEINVLARAFPPLAGDVDEYIDKTVEHITVFATAGIEAVLAATGTASKSGPDKEASS